MRSLRLDKSNGSSCGRSRMDVSPAQIRKLAAGMHTQAGVAARLGISTDTLQRRLREPEFRAAYEEGRELACAEIRDLQMEAARAGNVTMLIWLGKQLLGQRDSIDQTIGAPGGGALKIEIVRVEPGVEIERTQFPKSHDLPLRPA
jgi:hypothetical protein